MIKNALIAGATGLVGNELVSFLIKTEYYNSIHVLTRKPYDLEHLKLKSYEINFDSIDAFNSPALINDVYICLGTTMKKAATKENFRKVDYEYVIDIARWALKNNVQRLAVISSIGADAYSSNFYLRTKGEMEEALKALHLKHLIILRPSLLLGTRKEFRFAEKLAAMFMRPISFLMFGKMKKFRAVKARDVARAMYYYTINSKEDVKLISNEHITGINRLMSDLYKTPPRFDKDPVESLP